MTKLLSVFSLIIITIISSNSFGQTTACSGGSITLTENNCYTIGDGTPGTVQVTFDDINIFAQNGGNYDYIFVYPSTNTNSIGGYITVNVAGLVVSTPDNCSSCSGVTTSLSDPDNSTDGYITICFYNGGAGASTVDISWTTVDGSGNDACVETCEDGIQNQDETGVDCGGSFCIPCSCLNGIQDAGETGIDCGGPCNPCGTCFDGIQNGSETGVDCGGSCALSCGTNGASPDGGSANCCSGTTAVNAYTTNCDQIGTSAYNLNSPEVTINSGTVSGACLPTAGGGCGAYGTEGTWTEYDIESAYLQLAPLSVQGFGTGNSITYHAYFQGPDCASLSYVDCQPAIQFSSGGYFFFESSVSGLDPNQNVWVYTWNDNNKYFDYTVQAVTAEPASNQGCPGSAAIGEACNLGATGANFPTPGASGYPCDGGNWGSNENTTFYSFTADSTAAELIIDGIICNDGTNGAAQFGVWTSCAAISAGSYFTGDFLGCAVGTATLSLAGLNLGQTYYIASDGFAGDNCTWGFSGEGIVLPVEMAEFTAYHNGRDVELDWRTVTELNNDYFIVQRTLDGIKYENIGRVDGAGTTQEEQYYSFVDYEPYLGTSYYRLKQVDFDGQYKYTDVLSVRNGTEGLILVKTYNLMGQEVDFSYKGVVIDLYEDGSTSKRVQF